jgi:hypothetical protein
VVIDLILLSLSLQKSTNKMKKTNLLKILLVFSAVAAAVCFFSFKKYTPEGGAKYATMRTFEGFGLYESKIVIVYADGKSDEIALATIKQKNVVDNLTKINNALNDLNSKGYKPLFASSELVNDYGVVTTYTLEKQ